MKMRKISDRLYEFFELGPEDDNREITEVAKPKTKEPIDYSKYEYYFGEDFCMLKEDYCKYPLTEVDNDVIDVDYVEVDELIDHEMVEVVSKPKSKKDELIESLSYLKSKPNKTKQDRESIYTLEMVLKNMK